jgi:LmbE family N-acetylglucosaminyl deacetylase
MKILAVGPHPDDIEFGCAPVLIQETAKGHTVRMLVTSLGESASFGTPEERAAEARAAADVIGAEIEFLNFGGDCHVELRTEHCIAMARQIRVFQPQVILAPTAEENQHPDHTVVSKIVQRAARFARYGGLAELRDLPPHQIDSLYYYSITTVFDRTPDIVIDVTGVHALWEEAMRCHKTQVSSRAYIDLINARARSLGAAIGAGYAVGLWSNDPIRLNALSDLNLSSRNF